MCSSIGRLSDSTTGVAQAVDLEAERVGARRRAAGTAPAPAAPRSTATRSCARRAPRARAGNALAVRRRERRAPALEQRRCRAASPSASISASRSSSSQRRAAAASWRFELLAVERRHLARRGAHREVDARQHGVAEQHVEVGAGAGERRHQDALELHAQVGRVRLARHVDQARDEAVERVAPDEQAQPLPLAEREDAERGFVQLVVGDLEQLVARDRSRGCGRAPSPGGRPAAGRRARRSPRPCRAAAASRDTRAL